MAEHTEQVGLLRYTNGENSSGGPTHVRLTACPACGVPFDPETPFQIPKHIESHSPEDFGLSPMEAAG